MDEEYNKIRLLFEELQEQEQYTFPAQGRILDVPVEQGVYVIRNPDGRVVHVGRTLRGQNGLSQRLNDHVKGKSSFVRNYLQNGNLLRNGYTFQYLKVEDARKRALLEHFAIAQYCPAHLGLGLIQEPA